MELQGVSSLQSWKEVRVTKQSPVEEVSHCDQFRFLVLKGKSFFSSSGENRGCVWGESAVTDDLGDRKYKTVWRDDRGSLE